MEKQLILLIISIAFAEGKLSMDLLDNLNFIFYNVSHYSVIDPSTPETLLNESNFNRSKKTVFLAFDESLGSTIINDLINAYVGINEYNVLSLYYDYTRITSEDEMIQIGQIFADSLKKLFSNGLSIDSTELVGHSLGGHIVSLIANSTKPYKLPLTIGLDPSSDVDIFNKGYTLFTIALWTNSGEFGQSEWNGDVNFIANNGTRQPYCKNISENEMVSDNYCNHLIALKYWKNIIMKPNLYQGILCNQTNCNEDQIVQLGPNMRKNGIYYFHTSDKEPFGLGIEGTQHIQPMKSKLRKENYRGSKSEDISKPNYRSWIKGSSSSSKGSSHSSKGSSHFSKGSSSKPSHHGWIKAPSRDHDRSPGWIRPPSRESRPSGDPGRWIEGRPSGPSTSFGDRGMNFGWIWGNRGYDDRGYGRGYDNRGYGGSRWRWWGRNGGSLTARVNFTHFVTIICISIMKFIFTV